MLAEILKILKYFDADERIFSPWKGDDCTRTNGTSPLFPSSMPIAPEVAALNQEHHQEDLQHISLVPHYFNIS
jgi:hypothetical protein